MVHPTISPVTYACRFRDAMRSYNDHNWPSTLINRSAFERHYPYIVVSERSNGSIMIGQKDSIGATLSAITTGTPTALTPVPLADGEAIVHPSTQEEKDFLMSLAHSRVLIPNLHIVGLTDIEVDHYQHTYDICLNRINPTTHALL